MSNHILQAFLEPSSRYRKDRVVSWFLLSLLVPKTEENFPTWDLIIFWSLLINWDYYKFYRTGLPHVLYAKFCWLQRSNRLPMTIVGCFLCVGIHYCRHWYLRQTAQLLQLNTSCYSCCFSIFFLVKSFEVFKFNLEMLKMMEKKW